MSKKVISKHCIFLKMIFLILIINNRSTHSLVILQMEILKVENIRSRNL
jgi:hypothetical protein